MVEMAMQTKASMCIVPMQDILHLDSSARMNVPGTINGNWEWAFEWQQLESDSVKMLRRMIVMSERLVKHDV
jgi:4-alpha-glucanotransferase